MTELRFKLKLKGKCIGYMMYRLYSEGGCMLQWYQLATDDPEKGWRLPEPPECHVFDEMCPFVCQDRDGKDVYEGDRINFAEETGVVVYREQSADWGFKTQDNNIGLWETTNLPEHDFDIALLPDEA